MNKEMRSPASTKLTFQEEGDEKHINIISDMNTVKKIKLGQRRVRRIHVGGELRGD